VVFAFEDGEAAGVVVVGFNDGGVGGDVFFGEEHAFAKGGDGVGGDGLGGLDEVGFGDVAFGLGEGFGEAAVVGKDDEAGGEAVEASGEVEFAGPGLGDEVDDGGVLGVLGGADVSGGFMKDEVSGLLSTERLAGEHDVVKGVEETVAVAFDAVIDEDPAGGEVVAGLATADLGSGFEEAVEAHGGVGISIQYTEFRVQSSEFRVQNSDIGVRSSEFGDQRLAIGDWRLAIGDWRLAIGRRVAEGTIIEGWYGSLGTMGTSTG
jgi:hypothetical protein